MASVALIESDLDLDLNARHLTTYSDNLVDITDSYEVDKYEAYPPYPEKTQFRDVIAGLFDHFMTNAQKEDAIGATTKQIVGGQNAMFELEWALIDDFVDIVYFRDVHMKLLNHPSVSFESEKIYLSVSRNKFENTKEKQIRVRINGDEKIKYVLQNIENLNDMDSLAGYLEADTKTRCYASKSDYQHFKLKARICIEDDRSSSQDRIDEAVSFITSKTVISGSQTKKVHYRLIKRIKLKTVNNNFIDLSVVKSGDTIRDLMDSKEKYEIEIDRNFKNLQSVVTNDETKSKYIDDLLLVLDPNQLTMRMTNMVKWDLYFMFSNDSNLVQFNKHLRQKWFTYVTNWTKLNNLKDLMTTVVNIEPTHLPLVYYSGKYCITEKSDGVRQFFFVNQIGECYLIDCNFNIVYTGIKSETVKSTIFDGELVSLSSDPTSQVFLIFDCLFLDGKNQMHKPLLTTDDTQDCRLSEALTLVVSNLNKILPQELRLQKKPMTMWPPAPEKVVSSVVTTETKATAAAKPKPKVKAKPVSKTGLDQSKTYETYQDILERINNNQYEYNTDGLIFTLYTCSYYDAIDGGGYYQLFSIKWKPPTKLSADLLVEIRRDQRNHIVIEKDTNKFKILNLYSRCGSKLISRGYLEHPVDSFGNLRCYTVLDLATSKLELDGDEVIIPSGENFYDQSVVEFIYNAKNSSWIPVKFRSDKTANKNPNSDTTVQNVISVSNNYQSTDIFAKWETVKDIWDRVPEGQRRIPDPQATIGAASALDDPFFDYGSVTKQFKDNHPYRALLTLCHMVKFNVVRKCLMKLGVKTEKTEDTAPNPDHNVSLLDLACGRANDYDIWNQLINVYGVDKDTTSIDTIIKGNGQFNLVKSQTDKGLKADFYSSDLTKWKEFKEKDLIPEVDIITMQFALQFFFGSQETLERIIDDIFIPKLKTGGYLVISTFDGERIRKLLTNGVAVGFDDKEQLIWQINRLYSGDDQTQFGDSVESTIVPLKGYRKNVEYLVDINALTKVLKSKDFTRVTDEKIVPKPYFIDYLKGDSLKTEIDFYNTQFHTSRPPRNNLTGSKKFLELVKDKPYLEVLASYHTILVYQKGDVPP